MNKRKILIFGDSNTFGFNPLNGSRYDKNTRWSAVFKKEAENRGYEVTVDGKNNRSLFCPKDKTLCSIEAIKELLHNNYSDIILAVGINDLQFSKKISEEEFCSNFYKIINIIKNQSKSTNIILLCPSKLNENILESRIFSLLFNKNSIKNSKILPDIYKKIAHETNCKFIDLNKITPVSDIDGLHYDSSGHRKIALMLTELF